jgi:hypothetical protein
MSNIRRNIKRHIIGLELSIDNQCVGTGGAASAERKSQKTKSDEKNRAKLTVAATRIICPICAKFCESMRLMIFFIIAKICSIGSKEFCAWPKTALNLLPVIRTLDAAHLTQRRQVETRSAAVVAEHDKSPKPTPT